MDTDDRAPVRWVGSVNNLGPHWGHDLLADIELGLFFGGHTLDPEQRLSWVQLALVAAEGGEDRVHIQSGLFGSHVRKATTALFESLTVTTGGPAITLLAPV